MAAAQGGEELLIASDVFNEAIVADDRGRDTTEVQVTSRRSRVLWLASFFCWYCALLFLSVVRVLFCVCAFSCLRVIWCL